MGQKQLNETFEPNSRNTVLDFTTESNMFRDWPVLLSKPGHTGEDVNVTGVAGCTVDGTDRRAEPTARRFLVPTEIIVTFQI